MAGKQRKNKSFSIKGVGDYWEEVKSKVTIAITPTAIANLDAIASRLDISRSELVEQIGRGIIGLQLDKEVDKPNNPIVASERKDSQAEQMDVAAAP